MSYPGNPVYWGFPPAFLIASTISREPVWLTDVLGPIASHPVNKLQELLPGSWKPALTPYVT
jgi:hypothetical protein